MGQMNHSHDESGNGGTSDVLRDSRATLYPANRQHLENANIVLQVKIVLPPLSMCLYLSAALIFLAPRKLA